MMMLRSFILVFVIVMGLSFIQTPQAIAQCNCVTDCGVFVGACGASCATCETNQIPGTKQQFTDELELHKEWWIDVFWMDRVPEDPVGLLAAIQLMTNQLVANSLLQSQMIGSLFDAKHQLETQRLFQQLTAQAHKDYHPNEKLCEVGTIARPLAASERKSNMTAQYVSKYNLDRQLLAYDDEDVANLVENSSAKDKYSRLKNFIKHFCQPNDNSQNLNFLCLHTEAKPEYRNMDLDYTSFVDQNLTLDIDFFDETVTDDERTLFALTSNLIAEETLQNIPADVLIDEGNKPAYGNAAVHFLNARSLAAQRSVATNSIAAITGMKAKGDPVSDPFIYAIIDELFPEGFDFGEIIPGKTREQIITDYIGENPSYYAQMEVLTKKLYQHPNFYAELYDKPANVLRKDVAIQAAELMQKRDIYRSLLRSEAVLAVMLESTLEAQQSQMTNLVPKKERGWPVGAP